jgi:hypothetical protein
VYRGGLWRRLFLVTVIQGDLRGGLRRPDGGEIGGGATAFSWVVRRRLMEDGMSLFYETFISYLVEYINGF